MLRLVCAQSRTRTLLPKYGTTLVGRPSRNFVLQFRSQEPRHTVVMKETDMTENRNVRDYQLPSSMSISTRPIQAGDEESWRKHWVAYNEFYHRTDKITEEITSTTFSRFLTTESPIKCAVAILGDDPESERLVGFITWYPHPSTSNIEDVMYLHDLFVDPECRNGGIGRKLFEHAYAEADKAGIKVVYWHTQYFNHRAQLLYTKIGRRTDFIRYDRT